MTDLVLLDDDLGGLLVASLGKDGHVHLRRSLIEVDSGRDEFALDRLQSDGDGRGEFE